MRHNPDGVVRVRRSKLAAVAALLVIAAVGRGALAGTSSWNALNGNFNTAGNWTNGVPGSGDTAVFRPGTAVSYTVTFPGAGLRSDPINFVTDQLRIGSNTVSFVDGTDFNHDVVASTYTLDNSTTAESGRGIIIGETGSDTAAVLTTRLAMLSAVAATIGDAAGSNGTLNVSAGTFNITGSTSFDSELIIGRNGSSTGTLNVSGGADLNVNGAAGNSVLGEYTGSQGTATVTGSGSTWSTGSYVTVGNGGTGTLDIKTGGQVNNTGGYIGYSHGFGRGFGTVNVDGANSKWTNSGNLYVGASASIFFGGTGALSITAGGQVSNTSGYLGDNDSSTGTVTVDGASSKWTNNGSLLIGFNGTNTITVANSTLTVTNSGTVQATNVNVNSLGEIHGNGFIITGNVQNGGLVSPGNSAGALSVTGNYTQTPAGKLQIELGGTTAGTLYDQLIVSGAVTLSGTLQVSLINSFTPSWGNTFDILNWGTTVGGVFNTLTLPTLNAGLSWNTSQLYTNGILSIVLTGDYNLNGVVDAADYAIWRKGLGTTYTPADYDVWRVHFGQTPSSGAGATANAAIPEPATPVLLILATASCCLWRRRAA